MKRLIVALTMIINSASCQSSNYAPGFDFELFKNTPIYALAKAAEKQDTQQISYLVRDEKMDINFKEAKFDHTILILSLFNHKDYSVSKLLQLGSNPNSISKSDNISPLLLACKYFEYKSNPYKNISILIKYGADVNYTQVQELKTTRGTKYIKHTALQYLCNFGNLDCVKLLIQHGVSFNSYEKNGEESILYQASLNPRLEILHYLLIEKKLPIPDYCIVRQKGTSKEKKISLFEVVQHRTFAMEDHEKQMQRDILTFLEKNN